MPLSRARAFATRRELFALGHPLVNPAPIMSTGAFMGYYLGSKKRFHLDLTQLVMLGLVHSLILYIYGEKNTGKSTFIKHLIIVMCALQAGLAANGRDEDMPSVRALIHDRKVNLEKDSFGKPLRGEYGATSDYLLADTLELATFGRINPFDMRILSGLSEVADMALTLVESALGRPVSPYEGAALDIAVARMLEGGEADVLIEKLTSFLFAPSDDGMKAYFDVSNVTDAQAAIITDPRLKRAFFEDSTRVGAALKTIMGGQYGNLFGGDRTLYDIRLSQILNMDWTGITGKGGDLLETVNAKLDMHALRKRLPIIPDITASDEEGSKIKNPVHAAVVSETNRVQRAYPGAKIHAAQYSTDLLYLGSEGSEIRRLGREIDNGIGGRIFGRQPATEEIVESIMRTGFTHADALATTLLPQGCWCFKFPDMPPQFMQHIVPERLGDVIETNRSTKVSAARKRVSEMKYIQDRAQRIHGIWARVTAGLEEDPKNYEDIKSYITRETGITYEEPEE